MKAAMNALRETARLFWFDLRHGDPAALAALGATLGWRETIPVALAVKRQLSGQGPFATLNRRHPPSARERMSQRQMGPLIVLDRVLTDRGIPAAQRQTVLSAVSQRVGMAFLRYNLPVIDGIRFHRGDKDRKQRLAERLAGHFFNADGEIGVQDDGFSFNVHHCHFSHYADHFDVQHLMPLFCGIDADYVRTHQPDVVFFRSGTLAADRRPCDFRFTITAGPS